MPWYAPWSDVIKKKICRFLLQRYLGRFLEEKLTLDQLNVDFYNGTGTVHNVTLYCQALNELCEGQGWGIEVTGGHIGSVTVNVPYDSLLAKDSSIEVSNLTISLRPKARPTDGTSMLESMWSSMSSSMQLAQEYLERESTGGSIADCHSTHGGHGRGVSVSVSGQQLPASAMEGLENFAQIIDNVLNRIKAKLYDSEIRIEYLSPEGDRGVAVIVKIKSIDYQNEAGNDPPDRSPKASTSSSSGSDVSDHTITGGSRHQQQQQKSFLIATHATHHITIEGITFYTEEFRIDNPRTRRHQQRTTDAEPTVPAYGESMIDSEQFRSTISHMSDGGGSPPNLLTGGTGGIDGDGYFSYSNTCDNSSPNSRGAEFYRRSNSSGTDRETDPSEEEDAESDDELGESGMRMYRSGEIIVGKITSKQEIRLKMKQADNLPGPNVELELSVGSIQLFLTPRQLHSLVVVCDSFLGGNEEPPPRPTVREMKAAAGRRHEATSTTEMEFQQNMTRMGGGIGINQGWSLADPMQTMIEEQAEFLQRDAYRDEEGGEDYSESIISSTSSMTSSFTSNSTASRTTATSAASRRRMIDPDANADISKFNVRVAAVALVLLHEDILLESSQLGTVESPLSEASVQQLQTKADRFFRSIGNLGLGLGANDISNAGLVLDSGCDCSHLRLLLAPLILEGDEQRNRCGSLLRFSISIARADLREVLLEISVPLVEFYREQRPNSSGSSLPKRPEISITFEQSCNALRGTSGKRFSPPRTKIHVMMAPFLTEFDITILDRLSSLLYQAPFTSYYHNTGSASAAVPSPSGPAAGRSKLEAKTDLQLESLAVDFRLRFPIPDLRPIHDPQRVPWWRRNIRPDFLLLKLEQVRTGIALSPHPVYDISANEIKLFYYEAEPKGTANSSGGVGGVNIGKTVMQENAAPGQVPAVEYPRIIIEIPSECSLQKALEEPAHCATDKGTSCTAGAAKSYAPKAGSGHRNYEESDSDPTSGESFGVTTGRCKEDTPFSAKRVCRESDTPHSKTSASGVSDTPETLTLPGDTDEMNTFCSCAMKRAKLQIRVDLPVVSLQLKSKHLYEVIYNRISTDLLLWEPSAPSATAAAEAQLNAQHTARVSFREPEISLAGMGMMDSIYMPYTMCQSGIQLDSSSSATNSESESDSDGIFYSVYDRTRLGNPDSGGAAGTGRKSSSHSHRSSSHGGKLALAASGVDRDANSVAFRLNIGQGVLTMFAPVRDAQKHVIPGQFGEFVIRLSSGYIFSVSGFHGNTNLGYLCIQAKSAEFYHCGLIPTPSNNPPLRLINSVLPSYLQSTLYPTPKSLTLHEQRGCANREMLSLAIQIKSVPDLAIKRIRLAAGIQLTTLRHHSTLQQHAWLTQLLDMLDVVDYPVQGYVPLGVVTEMHLHLWDCAIDYRPLYFPYRAVITVGSFMISSNITTTSSGLTLNFIAEDVTLSLAPQQISITASGGKDSSSSGHQVAHNSSKITVLPSNELVCVLEVGLFEISLMLNERVTVKFPKFDLRTAINDVHVRTCADSARALAQLIGYLAAEGDLLLPEGDAGADISTSGGGISLAGGSDTAISGSGALEQKDVGGMQGLPMGGESEGELLPVRPPSSASGPVVTPKQQQHVNTLMADAMEESLYIESTSSGDGTGDDALLGGGAGVEMFFFPDERQRRTKDEKDPSGGTIVSDSNSNKRRFGSDDDSLSIDDGSSIPSSYHDDDHYLRQHEHHTTTHLTGADVDDDNASVNMRELMNFERSVLGQHPINYGIGDDDDDDTGVEALPQVTKELGDVNKLNQHRVESNVSSGGSHFAQRKISSDTDDDFCIIADEERPHRDDSHNQEVPVSEDPIRIVDNHFSIPSGKPDLLKAPEDFPSAVERYTICEMTVTWHIYGGRDFLTKEDRRRKAKQPMAVGVVSKSEKQTTVPTTVGTVHLPTALPMSEAYKSGVSYSKGSPSVSFGGPTNAALAKLTWKTRGGPDRKHDVTMEIHISKVQFSHETYPSNTKEASRQVLLINELEIVDGLAVSNIKKFLYHPKLPSRPTSKQSTNHMVVIKALHMRPNPALSAQECCLRVSILPIRLNIDQDSLLFLINYFNQLGGGGDINDANLPAAGPTGGRGSQTATPAHQPPVMTVESIPDAVQELQAKKMVSENLMLLIEEEEKLKDTQEGTAYSEAGDSAPIYFRNVIFSPDVPIRIDYHGKRMELSHGSLAGLLMGLGQLQCSEIRLKKISYRHGLLGVDRLLNFLLQEWLQDIKKHQLPKIIGGFGPMYSLVQLLQGIWDLFWLPIEQYQKDGRIVRGLQRGAQSFTARTALAALEITTRIIHLLQITAETAYDMISPGPSIRRGRGNRKGKRKRLHPPQDIREGMSNAIQIVREGITETAHNLVEITALEHDQKGYTGAVGAVMRQIPPIVVQPIVLATQATSNVLGGVKNQLVPDARAEAREKYKDDVE
ncbi:autophagy-related protein 2 homolog A isoform X1 [Anopheles funestus]|uniref:autophagy-related protein 2 homolog A isoform X1 n=1 Tax=Anopheles funestus TaxID=62324 RepID=UPI0020C6301F|nr:autophagy-related protein 2 homolog A isoform X1 [Anopheles funestus]XP_049276709.1 autophagy-related protein 2 homolog A isoform X1 [Anopheles funestus]